MNNTDDQKLLAELVKRAETGEHIKFDYIKSWSEYKSRKLSVKATEMLIKSLSRSADNLLKRYCKNVELGQADVTTLFVRDVLLRTREFYEKELEILFDMLDEYDAYLKGGLSIFDNILEQFVFLDTRPSVSCYDYRKLK